MTFVTEILDVIVEVATSLMGTVTGLLQSASGIFWVTTGENTGPTFIGVLVFITIGVPLVYYAINFVLGLIRQIRVNRK